MEKKLNITISTYNRAELLIKNLPYNLNQNFRNFTVTIIDDGSTDGTFEAIKPYLRIPNLCYIKLKRNVGIFQTRNLSLLLSDFDAITFHDADDIPNLNKLLIQSRNMYKTIQVHAKEHQNLSGDHFDAAVGKVICVDIHGKSSTLGRITTLGQDFLPNAFVEEIDKPEIEMTPSMVNKRLFERIGGFMNTRMEGWREFRNRAVATGATFCFIDEPLMTMVEYADSITLSPNQGNTSEQRQLMRAQVTKMTEAMKKCASYTEVIEQFKQTIDLQDVEIEYISNPGILAFNRYIPATQSTYALLAKVTA